MRKEIVDEMSWSELPSEIYLAIGDGNLRVLMKLRELCRELANCQVIRRATGELIGWKKFCNAPEQWKKYEEAILCYYHNFPFPNTPGYKYDYNSLIFKLAQRTKWRDFPEILKQYSFAIEIMASEFDEEDWRDFTLRRYMDDNFYKFIDRIDVKLFCEKRAINERIIRARLDDIDWAVLSENPKTPCYILEMFPEKFNWTKVAEWVDKSLLDKREHWRLAEREKE